jgi:hypothetical protein
MSPIFSSLTVCFPTPGVIAKTKSCFLYSTFSSGFFRPANSRFSLSFYFPVFLNKVLSCPLVALSPSSRPFAVAWTYIPKTRMSFLRLPLSPRFLIRHVGLYLPSSSYLSRLFPFLFLEFGIRLRRRFFFVYGIIVSEEDRNVEKKPDKVKKPNKNLYGRGFYCFSLYTANFSSYESTSFFKRGYSLRRIGWWERK